MAKSKKVVVKTHGRPATIKATPIKVGRFVYWTPRIFSLLIVAMFVVFSFDAFSPGASAGEMAVDFLLHNIPTLVLIAFVWLAWRHELVGAIVFGLLTVFFIMRLVRSSGPDAWPINELAGAFALTGSILLASILYFLNWKRKRA